MGQFCSKQRKNDNVEFWFGDLWPHVSSGRWDIIFDQLEKSSYARRIQKRYPTLDDCTTEKIAQKYNGYGPYRHRHAADLIQEIRSLLGKDVESYQHVIYPATMVDSIGRTDFSLIAYNRQTYNRQILLWPLSYHVEESRKGFGDTIPFLSKQFGVVFRGSCSSPIYPKQLDVRPPIKKTSRYEILLKNHHFSWADLGLTKFHLYEKDPAYPQEYTDLHLLDKGDLTREAQMQYKFVLCIEGADISTSFGWALASHCVAIHPYPFLFEVWYFKDLKPWIHFVPIALDGSDLFEVMQWCVFHPKECEKIAITSRNYMHRMCDPVMLSETKKTVCALWKLS